MISGCSVSEEIRYFQQFSKLDFVTREIIQSETKIVQTLNIIFNDFMKQLSTILNDTDKKIILMNIKTLRNIHSEILDKLKDAIKIEQGRTSRICAVYNSYKLKLMKEYVEYFSGMQAAISKVDSLAIKSNKFKNKLEDCYKKSGTFELSNLIRIPSQMVLKYHLLFDELNTNTDESHTAKRNIQISLDNMLDLAHYLNKAQRDKEILNKIDEIACHIQEFDPLCLRDFGHLVREDNVRIKENDKTFAKTRTIFLFDKALIICKSKGDNYHYKSVLNFDEYKLEDVGFDSINKSSTQINLVSTIDLSKTYSLLFKNTEDKQRNDWRNDLAASMDKVSPRGYNEKNHLFELYNFESEVLNCSLCKKVLLGVFYQGYKCTKCSSIAHKSCIMKFQSCSGLSKTSTASTSSVTCRIGDLDTKTIENSSWYIACERESAETILNEVQSALDSAIFLVRPRSEDGYAISIKLNSKIEHLRIHVLKFITPEGRESVNVYLAQQIQFPSIQELISYYMENTLVDNFPQLNTTLGIPFGNALPQAISENIAVYDYVA